LLNNLLQLLIVLSTVDVLTSAKRLAWCSSISKLREQLKAS